MNTTTLRIIDSYNHILDSRRHGNDNVALFLLLGTYGTTSGRSPRPADRSCREDSFHTKNHVKCTDVFDSFRKKEIEVNGKCL
jgi:hypothetical protein